MIQTKTNTTSPKRIARIAGVLYLLVGIFGGFAEGFVEPNMYVTGDAATTARNLLTNSGLVRIGIVADLFQATVWVFLGMTLYLLLKHANKSVARAMVVLVAIGTSIICLNTVFEFEDLLAQFLIPDFGQNIHAFVVIPSAIAEIWMVGYLLVIGVRTQKPDERIPARLRDPVAVDLSMH